MMTKNDAGFYYNISSDFFDEPKTLLPLKNSRLLVADANKVAVINTEIFPPNSSSVITDSTIDLFEIGTPFGLALAT
jgi:hypothetical protein